ncbi:MAG TPA: transporter [Pyrinomonadaceae bacterium]|nr:transporter [Pyrinomonadaceae bacterium]
MVIAATLAAFVSISAQAQSQCPDESDLINADRPGIADGSTVVGPKTFQFESGIQQEFRREGNVREHTFFVPTLLRFGIGSHWEARIEGNTFTRDTTLESTNPIDEVSGFAPVSLGFKYQIYDSNGDHQLSLGTIVRVFPTWGSKEFRTQHATGDIRLAADWNFAPSLKLSVNPNAGIARYEDDQGKLFTAALFATTLNYLPTKKLNPFLDVGVQSPETSDGKTAAILDSGIAYIIGQNLQIDASFGTRVHGETSPRPFLAFGISWRAKPSHVRR